jgi:hypothetical protein
VVRRGIGALAIPGLGPFIAAGPIMAALAGAGVGGAVGGVAGLSWVWAYLSMRPRGTKGASRMVESFYRFIATTQLGLRKPRRSWNGLALRMSLRPQKPVVTLPQAIDPLHESRGCSAPVRRIK